MSKERIGSIKDYTPNFKIIIPRFDLATWHDYIEENFRNIDALFFNLFGINNYSGSWKQITEYKQDQVLFIGDDIDINGNVTEFSGRLVKVLVDHVTDNSDYFNVFYNLHPEYYELFADASTAQIYAQQAQSYKNETEILKNETNSIKNEADLIKSEIITKQNEINDTISSFNEDFSIKSEQITQQIEDGKIIIAQETAISTENVEKSRIWAEGEQEEVETLGGTLSSRGHADLAMAIANADEDVPIDASSLIALDVIKGPKGDKGDPGKDGCGLEIGDIAPSIFGIDETKNLRRYLNGQVISQTQFETFTKIIKERAKLYPNTVATEENWQAEVASSKLGQCGKFVIDDTLGTIRLPKVVNIQGLQDLALMGGIKAESLPNITGSVTSSGGAWYGSVTQSGALYITKSGKEDSGGGGDNGVKYNLDASRSSSTYKNKAPVQQEAIQYPYFIQVATGVEESVDVTREIELNNPFFLGMSQYFESEPNNASWLISNGSFHSGAVYRSFYEWLLEIYNGAETVEGVSVKASTDTYGDYDYVINTEDTTFRLPIYDGSESLPSDRYIDLTLDATGSTYTAPANGYFAILKSATSTAQYMQCRNNTTGFGIETHATSNNTALRQFIPAAKGQQVVFSYTAAGTLTFFRFIYAKGNGSLYFYVGETIQDANIINASGVLTRVAELNDSYISGLGMPSQRYVNLTLGATGSSYTAPANGWFAISKKSGAVNQYVNLAGTEVSIIAVTPSSGTTASCYLPVRKGDVVKCWWTASGTLNAFRFVYAEGDK